MDPNTSPHERKPEPRKPQRLTEEQRRLVHQNIGLVALHLRRNVGNLGTPRRDRERDDLFQEGCLGLIQAAAAFQQEAGIPFAAFALPRIHNAVSRALEKKFHTVNIPSPRTQNRGTKKGRRDPAPSGRVALANEAYETSRTVQPPPPARVVSLSEDRTRRLTVSPNRRSHHPAGPIRETIGERLRDKYDRTVWAAGKVVAAAASRRGDRDKLVRVLVEERFLVPHPELRTPLRRIARQTGSSYARVAQCHQRLAAAIRRLLETDPEYRELRRRARTAPEGIEESIDPDVERALARASADEFTARFRAAASVERAGMLDALLKAAGDDPDPAILRAVRNSVGKLSNAAREQLLQDAYLDAARTARKRASPVEP